MSFLGIHIYVYKRGWLEGEAREGGRAQVPRRLYGGKERSERYFKLSPLRMNVCVCVSMCTYMCYALLRPKRKGEFE